MYVSCSNRPDLLCDEDSEIFSSSDSPVSSSEFDSPADVDECIAVLIEDERHSMPGFDYLERFQSQSVDIPAREESVAWILKVQAYYGFQPLTAYLSVNYLDRFLCSRKLPQTNGWPLQLLSVACLSLASKMEELLVPSLLDFQVEGAKYLFEPRTIRRMEFLVLGVLDWRLRSTTPFCFITFFACKLDSEGTSIGILISRATDIIFSNIRETCFLQYWPSCVAAAAIICAANEIPHLYLVKPEHAESWCDGLDKEKIISCHQLMKQHVVQNYQRKTPIIPQSCVTVQARMRSIDSSSLPSTSSSSLLYKKRNLDNCFWVDDDTENSNKKRKEIMEFIKHKLDNGGPIVP